METAIWMALFIILWVAYEDIYSNTWVSHHFCADSMKEGTVLGKKAKSCLDIHGFIFFLKKEWKTCPPNNSECMNTECLSPLTLQLRVLQSPHSMFFWQMRFIFHTGNWQAWWIKSLYKINNFTRVSPKLIVFTYCLWFQAFLDLSGEFV